ncbi:transmembrane protein 273-like [Morone saxatilis]|uniref:transmembrane protein 273-like n=1 Tax=Morone saxatilis TaxID=34816 RepID=UPI0015E247B9|nr:transmembrane protein 273-like [Morone saxatilis]
MSVRGDGADSEERLDIKYVLIGAGIGLFLVAGFIILKVCSIRKQVNDNVTVGRTKTHSEPHLITLSHLSQSDHPVAAVSDDMRC